jgi:hypothetical protein
MQSVVSRLSLVAGLLTLAAIVAGYGPHGGQTLSAQRLPLRMYSSADGLAGDHIAALLADSRGFLWIGTTTGLSRFDGREFRHYGPAFVLLVNDNASAVTATIRFLLEGGAIVHPVTLPAHQRVTVYAGHIPELVDRSFGIEITATQPIIAERSMYFPVGGARVFEGGTEAAGVNDVSRRWLLAEGATGPFFECYILLSNPNEAVAHTTVTYLPESGETIVRSEDVPANGRLTINVETVDPRLANTPVSTTIESDVGIVAERSMYWPDISLGWREAHNSVGVTDAALRWGVADGRIGGPRGYATYILLANPNSVPAEVEVGFLKGGVRGPVQTFVLPPTSRHNIWVNNDFPALGDGLFSAEVRVLNYQPIVVEKALYWNSGAEVWAAGTGVVATPLPPP